MADEDPEENSSGGMKKLIAALTLLLLLAVAVRIYSVWRQRREDAKVVDRTPIRHVSADDLVVPKKLYQTTLKDARDLDGHRVWVFASGQMKLYPATAAHVDYAHPAGLLHGAEPLDVVNFIEQVAPATGVYNIPRGDRHVLMLFHRASDPGKLYATPVGYVQGGSYTYFLDEAFFYDDPHTLYKWSPETWKAIDEHRAIPGMNERQANLALGQVSTPGPGTVGNRTVVYDNEGHPVTVTFAGGKATKIDGGA